MDHFIKVLAEDSKLLALPEGVDVIFSPDGNGAALDVFTAEQMEDYARANVAVATAPLQAEVEALRALLLEACDDGDEADADLLATLERARTAEARAERLAEALKCLNSATRRYMEERPVSDAEWASDEPSVLSIVDAALEQEEGK